MNMKKTVFRIFAVLFAAVFLFALAGCGDQNASGADPEQKTPATLSDVYNAVFAAVPDADKLTDVQDSYLSGFLKASPEDFAGYKIVTQSISTSVDEIGIFEAKSAEDVAKIEAMIDTFFEFRLAIWDSKYLEEEFPKLQNAQRVTSGNFVMYVILSDDARAAAVTAFENITK